MSEVSQLTVFLDEGSGAFTKDGRNLQVKIVTGMPTFSVPVRGGKAPELIEALCTAEVAHHVELLRQIQTAILPDLRRMGPRESSGWNTATSQRRRWDIGSVKDDESGALQQHVYVSGEPHVVVARTSLTCDEGCDAAAVRCLLSALIQRRRAELERFYGTVLGEFLGYLQRN